MKIITVGSGVIVEDFIKATHSVNNVEVVGCYSRDLSRAKQFAQKMGIMKYYDSLSTIVADDEIDTVYIASPNALHYSQAKYFLENHKHVIIEKPIMSEVKNGLELLELAKKNKLFVFEAISNVHTPNFEVFKEHLDKLGPIKLVQANYSQYSSRYDLFMDGETPNVFNPAFSGGSLMDLNIYNIQLTYHLFGLPIDSHYFPNIERGIDTSGVLVMDYGSFKAVTSAAKDSASTSYFQVQGVNGYIRSTGPTNELPDVFVKTKDMEFTVDYNVKHRLVGEVETFGKLFEEKDFETVYHKFEQSLEVLSILEKSWNQANLGFKDRE